MIFATLFVASLVIYPKIVALLSAQSGILPLVATICGFMAGFLGVRAVYAVLERIGISADLVHGGVEHGPSVGASKPVNG
jgi:hypothetical protein